MDTLINRYAEKHGYKPTISELYSLYTQGELTLSDTEENALLKAINN